MFHNAASEFALFDKSTSVVSCKKTNRIVREYIGATGKGPLVGAEKRLLRKNVVEKVDPDNLDDYFTGKWFKFMYLFLLFIFAHESADIFCTYSKRFYGKQLWNHSHNQYLEQHHFHTLLARQTLIQ